MGAEKLVPPPTLVLQNLELQNVDQKFEFWIKHFILQSQALTCFNDFFFLQAGIFLSLLEDMFPLDKLKCVQEFLR